MIKMLKNIFIIIILIVFIVGIIIYKLSENIHLDNTHVPFYMRNELYIKYNDSVSNYINIKNKDVINVVCTSGLCNRLATMLGFLYICQKLNKKLYVSWIPDNCCNGYFEDYFEKIDYPNFFITSKNIEDFYFCGQINIKNNCNAHNIKYDTIVELKLLSLIKPKMEIQNKIDIFCDYYDIKNTIGLHVRRTDFTSNIIGKLTVGAETDDNFFRYIDRYDKKQCYYLATDNSKTQRKFKRRYNDRIIYYEKIKNNKYLRKTTLEQAIIDIFILSYCKKIKGTNKSSFSRLARMIKYCRNCLV